VHLASRDVLRCWPPLTRDPAVEHFMLGMLTDPEKAIFPKLSNSSTRKAVSESFLAISDETPGKPPRPRPLIS
jgi:hypothetical protein